MQLNSLLGDLIKLISLQGDLFLADLSTVGLSLLCSKICYYAFWNFPNFFPIMLVFMLFRNALCFYFVCDFFFVQRSFSYDRM